ncbi:MAG: lytic transglycosylase domain-containing protein [Acidobacteriia bacterium]|nr:lytic transglycosylase domain-containing protein [Terriglobia bacterium]MBV8904273.1 lytic transglycosylase domain-containing protein [Terriglobia bacterium]
MPVENITGEQALEMLAAASRRYARREWELETARKLVDRQSLAPASLTSYQRERDRAYEQWEAADSRFRFIQQRSRRSRSGWLLQARLITSRFQARARLATANCLPLDQNALSGTISGAAAAHRLDPALLRAMIRQESAFYPCAISSKGAMGLMQLMPATAEQFHLADPFDPSSNIDAGAEYMRSLLDRFEGDLPLALASYNAGPNRQNQKAALEIPETSNYVKQILNSLEPATAASFSLAK